MITFNNTKTIKDLVVNVGREYENRVFVRYERDDAIYEKGYGTFTVDTLAIAAYIESQNKKLGHSTHAAILGKCSYEFLTVLMGVPCAGGISIPLDVQQSNETLVENLTKADVDILFYDRDYSSQAEYIQENCPQIKRFVCLQSRKNVRCVPMIHKVYRGEELHTNVKPEECGMIIFTSGTTGHGKGVMLSHANVIDNMFCTDDDVEVCLNVLPIHHIFCISGDVFLVLRYGSTLCICDDIAKLLYYIQLFQPSMMRVVPMMAKMLVNRVALLKSKNPDEPVSKLREQVLGKRMNRLTSGGGYLSPELAQSLLDLGITTAQGYGMSECSPKISAPDYSRKDKTASVGRLVTGCMVRIVDDEIQVKSPSVMMGYYNDPELTKEVLTEDGWLCTGDMGYLDDENFLYLNGRKKNLIILSNGENVSPELIENKFDGDRLIAEMVAYGSGEIIAAEFFPNFEYAQANGIDDCEAAIKELVAKHNKELPSYAQISEISIRNTPFKKTSSKKVVRSEFFAEKDAKEKAITTARKPETELQKKLYEMCVAEIGNEEFGIDDNLYKFGLDSMGSTMLIADIAKELEKDITLSELMDNNTIILLEQFLLSKDAQKNISFEKREWYPLTGMQMYFAYVIAGNTTGNLPFSFRLSKEIDLNRLKEAIYKVLDAHPGLKGKIKPTPDKYYGFYRYDDRIIDIPIKKIKDEDAEETLRNSIVAFNYAAADDLVHIALYETEKSNYMFFDVSHAVGDGVSMNLLMEDIDKAYRGEEIIEEGDYSIFEFNLEYAVNNENGKRDRDLQYFSEFFEGTKLNRSILGKSKIEDLSNGVYGAIRRRFDRVPRKELLYYGKKHGVSENAMFIAAYNYLISLFSDEDDVISCSIHSGRIDSRYTNIAGALFQTYHSRYIKEPHEKVEDYIKKTGEQIMTTMKCVTPISRQGEMFFQFQGDILKEPTIGGVQTERVKGQLDSLPFHFQVMYDDNGYYIELRYWENRFDREILEIFLGCYEEVLRAILNEETSVRCLKHDIDDKFYPKHFYIEASKLNSSLGRTLIANVDDDEKVKVYVLDDDYKKKPYGAWGMLYIMDYEPVENKGVLQYPYGIGALYITGLVGRIMPDGSVDFLENCGRLVLTDGAMGRKYHDLRSLEDYLISRDDIENATTYLRHNIENNEMALGMDLYTKADIDMEVLAADIKENCDEILVPKFVNIVK